MWYGDKRVYGARMGQEFAEQKHRQYRDHKRVEDARDVLIRAATGRPVEQGSRVRTLNMMRARWRALQKTAVPTCQHKSEEGKRYGTRWQQGIGDTQVLMDMRQLAMRVRQEQPRLRLWQRTAKWMRGRREQKTWMTLTSSWMGRAQFTGRICCFMSTTRVWAGKSGSEWSVRERNMYWRCRDTVVL